MRFFKVDDTTTDEEAILRLAGKYWLQVSENAKFSQDLKFDIGEEITSTESVSATHVSRLTGGRRQTDPYRFSVTQNPESVRPASGPET